jgi:hypothetical protein
MNRQENAIIFIICVFGVVCVWMYYYSKSDIDLKCIVAGKDGNTYCVRDKKNMKASADLLAEATEKMIKLAEHMKANFPEDSAVKRLVDGFDPKKISETLPNSTLVAFTENKNKMMFCLTEKKGGGVGDGEETKLIDINTLMFVAIHEMSHISCKSIGHKQEFWDNFKFLLIEAEKIGIYNPVDYKKEPREFCGMNIKDNPYYDL